MTFFQFGCFLSAAESKHDVIVNSFQTALPKCVTLDSGKSHNDKKANYTGPPCFSSWYTLTPKQNRKQREVAKNL